MRADFIYFIMISSTNMEFREDKIYERFETHR